MELANASTQRLGGRWSYSCLPGNIHRSRLVQLVWQSSSEEQFRRLAEERRAAKSLMMDIKCCQTWQQLARLHARSSAVMNHLHVSATITHLAQLLARTNHTPSSADPGSSNGHGSRSGWGGSSSSSSTSSGRSEPADSGNSAQTGGGLPSSGNQPQGYVSLSSSSQILEASLLSGLDARRPAVATAPLLTRPPDLTTIASFMPQLLETVVAHLSAYEGRQIANTLWALSKLHASGVYTPPRSIVLRLLMETAALSSPPSSSSSQSRDSSRAPSTPPNPAPAARSPSSTATSAASGQRGARETAQQAFNPGRISDGQPGRQTTAAGGGSSQGWASQARSDAGLPSAVLLGSLHNRISLPSVMLGSVGSSSSSTGSATLQAAATQSPSAPSASASPSPPQPPSPSTHNSTTASVLHAWYQPTTSSHGDPSGPTNGTGSSTAAGPTGSSSGGGGGGSTSQTGVSTPPQGDASGTAARKLGGVRGSAPGEHAVCAWDHGGGPTRAVDEGVLLELPSFKPPEVSMTLYSLALIQQCSSSRSVIDPASLGVLLLVAEAAFHRFRLQELVNVLWAASRLGTLSSSGRLQDSGSSSSVDGNDSSSTSGDRRRSSSSSRRSAAAQQTQAGGLPGATSPVPAHAPETPATSGASRTASPSEREAASATAADASSSTSDPILPAPSWVTHLLEVTLPLLTEHRISNPILSSSSSSSSMPPSHPRHSSPSSFIPYQQQQQRAQQRHGDYRASPPSSDGPSRPATPIHPGSDRAPPPGGRQQPAPPASPPPPQSAHSSVPQFALTALVSSLGRLRFQPPVQSLHRLLAALPPLDTLAPQELSDLLIGLVHMEYAPHPAWRLSSAKQGTPSDSFLPPVRGCRYGLARATCNARNQSGGTGPPSPRVSASPLPPDLEARTLLVHTRVASSEVWSRSATQAVLKCLGRCTAQNLVTCLWAMSHHRGSLQREFFTPYLYHVSRVMGDLKSSELALLINSLARVRIRPGPIWMDRFCIEVYPHLPRMDPQSHAILVNALATLNHKPSAMWMSAAEEASLPTLGNQQSPAGLSQLLYGFAMLGHRPRQRCTCIITNHDRHKRVPLRVRPLQSPHHSPCNLHRSLPLVNNAMGGRTAASGPQPQDADLLPDRVMLSLPLALRRSGERPIRSRCSATCRPSPPQDFASLLWSLAMLDARPPVRLLTTLLSSLGAHRQGMSRPSMTQALWALARWQPLPDGPWQAEITSMQRQLRVSNAHHQAKLAAAAAAAAALHSQRAGWSSSRRLSAAQAADEPERAQQGATGDEVWEDGVSVAVGGGGGVGRGIPQEPAGAVDDVVPTREEYNKVVLQGLVTWAAGRVNVGRHIGVEQIYTSQSLFTVYVHHTPGHVHDQPSIFTGREIPELVETTNGYGQHALIVAERALMREALKNTDNLKFLMVSHDSVPLYPPYVIWLQLMAEGDQSRVGQLPVSLTGKGWLPEMATAHFKEEHFRTSSQWVVLSRVHAMIVVRDVHLDHIFDKMCGLKLGTRTASATRWVFIPSLLATYNALPETDDCGCATHVVFMDGVWSPHSYQAKEINDTLVRRLRFGYDGDCDWDGMITSARNVFQTWADGGSVAPFYNSTTVPWFNATHAEWLAEVAFNLTVVQKEGRKKVAEGKLTPAAGWQPSEVLNPLAWWVLKAGYQNVSSHCTLFSRKFPAERKGIVLKTMFDCTGGGLADSCLHPRPRKRATPAPAPT
ncbi:MAG: hypothetical protein WDW38_011439 [Sanguina aurantia]